MIKRTQSAKQCVIYQEDQYGLTSSVRKIKPDVILQNIISPKTKDKKMFLKKKQSNRDISLSSTNSNNSKATMNNLNNISMPLDQFFLQNCSQNSQVKKIINQFKNRQICFQKIKQYLTTIIKSKNVQLQNLHMNKYELDIIYNKSYNSQRNFHNFQLNLQKFKKWIKVKLQLKNLYKKLTDQTKNLNKKFNLYDQYQNILENKSNRKNQKIDESKEILNNLEEEVSYLLNQLQVQKKKNSRELKQMNQSIQYLRASIHKKQNVLKQLKSNLCRIYIRSHRNQKNYSLSQNKSIKKMTLSIKKITLSFKKIIQQNKLDLQQAFIGSKHFKSYSQDFGQKIRDGSRLMYLRFYIPKDKKQGLKFQCIYQQKEEKIHSSPQNYEGYQTKQNLKIYQIQIKSILSMKFFFSSKIVGIQLRVKDQRRNKHIQIGDCDPKIDHQLLTLINKRLVTIYSHWHQNQMIGVSLWYKKESTKQLSTDKYHKSASRRDLSKSCDQKDILSEYYN